MPLEAISDPSSGLICVIVGQENAFEWATDLNPEEFWICRKTLIKRSRFFRILLSNTAPETKIRLPCTSIAAFQAYEDWILKRRITNPFHGQWSGIQSSTSQFATEVYELSILVKEGNLADALMDQLLYQKWEPNLDDVAIIYADEDLKNGLLCLRMLLIDFIILRETANRLDNFASNLYDPQRFSTTLPRSFLYELAMRAHLILNGKNHNFNLLSTFQLYHTASELLEEIEDDRIKGYQRIVHPHARDPCYYHAHSLVGVSCYLAQVPRPVILRSEEDMVDTEDAWFRNPLLLRLFPDPNPFMGH